MPHLTEIHPSKLEVALLDRFSVTFGVEGSSISLACSMVVVPDLPNVPPLAQWYRDGKMFVRSFVQVQRYHVFTDDVLPKDTALFLVFI